MLDRHRFHVSHLTGYRYGSGRQRYLVRARDPNNGFAILGSGQWRDYLGESVYNDYMVEVTPENQIVVTPGTAYAPGIGFDDPALADMPAYVGADQIGTTRRVTDSAAAGAAVIERTVYTAFGERLSLTDGSGNPAPSPVSRYGYAGAWGYEEATCEPPGTPTGWCDPLTTLGWLHVGARYYDPALGRFMQRDPIGIMGGLNVYEYVRSNPTQYTGSLGLDFASDGFPWHIDLVLMAGCAFLGAPAAIAVGTQIVVLDNLDPITEWVNGELQPVGQAALDWMTDLVNTHIQPAGETALKWIAKPYDWLTPIY